MKTTHVSLSDLLHNLVILLKVIKSVAKVDICKLKIDLTKTNESELGIETYLAEKMANVRLKIMCLLVKICNLPISPYGKISYVHF